MTTLLLGRPVSDETLALCAADRGVTVAEYVAEFNGTPPTISVADAATRIRVGLRDRSGMDWSVTAGRGRYADWLTIHVPPRQREGRYFMGEHDRKELAGLLGMPLARVEATGVAVLPRQRDRMVARAEGGGGVP